MAKSRTLAPSLALLLLLSWGAGLGGFVSSAAAASGGAKQDDKSAQDKIRGMFNGELIVHTPMPIFSISIIGDDQITDQVNIAIVLETKSAAAREAIIRERHKLHDAFLRDLYGLLNIRRSDGQLFDQQVVKIRLLRVADKLLGQGVVNNILVRGISQRPLS